MELPFLHIKRFFGKKVLSKQLKKHKKRKVKSCNINEANSFGILCVVKDEEGYKKVVKLIKYLKNEFGIRNIKALAFYPKIRGIYLYWHKSLMKSTNLNTST